VLDPWKHSQPRGRIALATDNQFAHRDRIEASLINQFPCQPTRMLRIWFTPEERRLH